MTLLEALMNSQHLTEEDATELIAKMANEVNDGANPEEVLHEQGLEPDYVIDLLNETC